MSIAINPSSHPSQHISHYKSMTRATTSLWSSNKVSKLDKTKIKIAPLYRNGKSNKSRLFQIMSSQNEAHLGPSQLSTSHTIQQFYIHINEKNLKQLENYISNDCYFEDCSFPKPFRGKKEVMNFFELLTVSMGRDMAFNIEHICKGDEFTAGATWHLEWKKTPVPFTRGCSFFECSQNGDLLIIKKAKVVSESPIKFGSLALAILKTVALLFDMFPETTEWFLKSPHVILHWLVKINTILLLPFIKPVLEGYIRIWNIVTRLIGHAFNILLHITKLFFK